MDRVRVGPVKGLKIAIAAFVLSIVLFLVVIVGSVFLLVTRNNDVQDFSKQLRAGLVKNCERNGNPLRQAVQGQLEEQIGQREHLNYTRFFPNVPPAELKRLLDKQNRADRATLKQIAPVNCAGLYPKP